jgi:hypothetical protein
MNDETKQVPSDLTVKATAALQSDIDRELNVPDPEEKGALARMYKESDKDKGKKKKKDK